MVRFSVIQTGRTAQIAFGLARQEALYWWGHAGRTGTIAEKDGYRIIGQLSSRHLSHLDTYLRRAEAWHLRTDKNKAALPTRIPRSVAPLFVEAMPTYLDESGPAVCLQITGTAAVEIKAEMGRKRTWDKVFWFGGMSPK